ncbi:MAG TPA: Sec-independent protein translocase protein TatB [Steroidobacteraceae bacterium]|nr:Sec-independent protein translocase protein TatB [Steroidobacteraceae bacterium]
MFEVGFTEIILILGLALLVLGPEKLPGLAEKLGRWTGRARSMARQLRTQLEQEVTIEQMAKSKPMQAMDRSPPDTSPSATSAGAQEWPPTSSDEIPPAPTTPPPEPAPPGGFDLDQHLAEVDTTPEAMHGTQKDKVET